MLLSHLHEIVESLSFSLQFVCVILFDGVHEYVFVYVCFDVWVCVCVCERERELVSVCVCVCVDAVYQNLFMSSYLENIS